MSLFKVGDVVQLKSGGPKMTIVAPSNGKWQAKWFADFNTTPHHDIFPEAALVAVEERQAK